MGDGKGAVEQHVVQFAEVEEEGDQGLGQPGQQGRPVVGRSRIQKGGDVLFQGSQASLPHCRQQVVPGFEAGVEGALRRSGGHGDVLDANRPAAGVEQRVGGLQQFLSALAWGQAAAHGTCY